MLTRRLHFPAVFSLLLSSSFSFASSPPPTDGCGRGWIYFDLGNTLVDTHQAGQTRYLPGALSYLHELREAGFHLGMITNIPEQWGSTEAEKIAALHNAIESDWAPGEAPFEWADFERVLIPMKDSERKPAQKLFKQALDSAPGCRFAYLGEDGTEVEAARTAGFEQGHIIGTTPGALYPPVGQVLPGPGAHLPSLPNSHPTSVSNKLTRIDVATGK